MEFYTYMWLRENRTPYYVGKGQGKRAFTKRNHRPSPPKDHSRIIIFPMNSEELALESEKALIELFGRKDLGTGYLRNLTDGGDGGPVGRTPWNKGQAWCFPLRGIKRSKETRKKIANSKRGHKRAPFSAVWRNNLSLSTKGLKKSEETRKRISLGLTGRKKSPEYALNNGKAQPAGRSGYKGIMWSEQRKKWQIRVRRKHFGFYSDLALAVQALAKLKFVN